MLDQINTRELMADAKFYESYSRYNDEKGRYETWEEAVDRVMDMHRSKYADVMNPRLEELINEAERAYKEKRILGAQRALQFGGKQLMKHNMRLYNCTSSYVDRPEFFGELFYILLCGAGAGFSVQKHHVKKLPKIQLRKGQAKIHKATDDIEGWATSLDVLMSSFFVGGGKYPEYEGRRVYFDTSDIRNKDAEIDGGFKAPGPEPLRKALDLIEHLLNDLVMKQGITQLEPIHVYDICMYAADAVLAGGVRRSATICIFSFDDEKMMNAKTGNWYVTNPQRGRSNNSALLVRSEVTKEQFARLMKSTKEFGEPGFVFSESTEVMFNPCVEIGMYPVLHQGKKKISGWQGCNLTEGNGAKCVTFEDFVKMCRASAILGTLQAGYTDFSRFLPKETEEIFKREALLGCSITGWLNSPDILLKPDNLEKGVDIIRELNEEIAGIIGIEPAARLCCVKPSGNASVALGTISASSAEHSERYLRNVTMNKSQEVAQLIKEKDPYMVEDSVWSNSNSDYIISFPVITPKGSKYKKDVGAIDALEIVKLIQKHWVNHGTNIDRCVNKDVRHNVSNTINVGEDEWDAVEEYLYDNREYFAGVSMLSKTGDKDYNQAPFTAVMTEQEIVEKYGHAALFASGLIVDSTKGFSNLWDAIYIAKQDQQHEGEKGDLQAEWVRRFRKFADNYFDGDKTKADYCLKDVYLLHRWTKIQQNFVDVDFKEGLREKQYTDINTMGAAACAGGACEI